jgi:hypothetical protein
MGKLTIEQAKEAAETICVLGGISIRMADKIIKDPWIAAEQQMYARVITMKQNNNFNGKVWEAGYLLKNYFIQEGKLSP